MIVLEFSNGSLDKLFGYHKHRPLWGSSGGFATTCRNTCDIPWILKVILKFSLAHTLCQHPRLQCIKQSVLKIRLLWSWKHTKGRRTLPEMHSLACSHCSEYSMICICTGYALVGLSIAGDLCFVGFALVGNRFATCDTTLVSSGIKVSTWNSFDWMTDKLHYIKFVGSTETHLLCGVCVMGIVALLDPTLSRSTQNCSWCKTVVMCEFVVENVFCCIFHVNTLTYVCEKIWDVSTLEIERCKRFTGNDSIRLFVVLNWAFQLCRFRADIPLQGQEEPTIIQSIDNANRSLPSSQNIDYTCTHICRWKLR